MGRGAGIRGGYSRPGERGVSNRIYVSITEQHGAEKGGVGIYAYFYVHDRNKTCMFLVVKALNIHASEGSRLRRHKAFIRE